MQSIIDTSHKVSRVMVWIGGALILMAALTVTLEVILRKFFDISIAGADELSGYAFGIATTFGMAYALFERAHIRVDALYNLFPDSLKLIASFVGLLLLAGFTAVVCYTGWGLVADTINHGSRSITPMRTPLILPQLPWLAGWLFFSVLLFARIDRVCCVPATRRFPTNHEAYRHQVHR